MMVHVISRMTQMWDNLGHHTTPHSLAMHYSLETRNEAKERWNWARYKELCYESQVQWRKLWQGRITSMLVLDQHHQGCSLQYHLHVWWTPHPSQVIRLFWACNEKFHAPNLTQDGSFTLSTMAMGGSEFHLKAWSSSSESRSNSPACSSFLTMSTTLVKTVGGTDQADAVYIMVRI